MSKRKARHERAVRIGLESAGRHYAVDEAKGSTRILWRGEIEQQDLLGDHQKGGGGAMEHAETGEEDCKACAPRQGRRAAEVSVRRCKRRGCTMGKSDVSDDDAPMATSSGMSEATPMAAEEIASNEHEIRMSSTGFIPGSCAIHGAKGIVHSCPKCSKAMIRPTAKLERPRDACQSPEC